VPQELRDALLKGVKDFGVPRIGGEASIDPEETRYLVHRQLSYDRQEDELIGQCNKD
jgi:hypothetical protein